MARESFQDIEIAETLNKNYLSIKVDREERPDIDAVYMTVCQAMTGGGGWPLTTLMTPDKAPFFAGTYLPKTGNHKAAGLQELLDFVAQQWKTGKSMLLQESNKIAERLKAQEAKTEESTENTRSQSPEALMEQAIEAFQKAFDPRRGGFGAPPKFPSPHNLLFLLDAGQGEMVEKTLVQMYRGGIFDHIGGGFSRYSTDARWLVPHFEKMLYDNALLLSLYTEAFQKTGKTLYAHIACQIADYVLAELSHPKGGFFCGQDADSEGEEGKYYTLTPEEVKEALGRQKGEAFCRCFDITKEGNFEGKNIPNLLKNPQYETPFNPEMKKTLYHFRKNRTSLHRDEKILTSWNGLMIAAMAKTGRILKKEAYRNAALEAEDFLWNHLRTEENTLWIRWKDGETAGEGQLDDYAFYALALLECYRSTLGATYLTRAIAVTEKLLELFFDETKGGCYLYSHQAEQLLLRPKEIYDGAVPSGNSVAAMIMVQLFQLTGEERWRKVKEKQLDFLARKAAAYPIGQSFFLYALQVDRKPTKELVCVTKESLETEELARLGVSTLLKTPENKKEIEEAVPFLKAYPFPDQGACYYLCQDNACSSPVTSFKEIQENV